MDVSVIVRQWFVTLAIVAPASTIRKSNMKKVLIAAFLAVSLTACSGLSSIIPSFWDDNQSARMVDIHATATNLDCTKPHLPQVTRLKLDMQWFELYSENKGWLQRDVLKLVAPMKKTIDDFYKRSSGEKQGSVAYCNIKKKLLIKQSRDSAQAVLGRYEW